MRPKTLQRSGLDGFWRLPYQGVEKQGSGRQARRAAIRQAQHIQAYVSIGESRATLNGGLRRSFSTPC